MKGMYLTLFGCILQITKQATGIKIINPIIPRQLGIVTYSNKIAHIIDTPKKINELKSLETAFNDFHNIKINELNLHHNHTIKTNHFKGMPGILTVASLSLLAYLTPAVEIAPLTVRGLSYLG